jgi:hypothetical protein
MTTYTVPKYLAVAATILVAVPGLGNATAPNANTAVVQNHLTGCLTIGSTIDKIAIGDKPARPCAVSQIKVTISTAVTSTPYTLVPFLIALDGDNVAKTIGTFGPFTLSATCKKIPVDANFDRKIDIAITAAVDGWLVTNDHAPRAANTSVVLTSNEVGPFDHPAFTSDPDDHVHTALASDGSRLALDQVQFGFNMIGHSCTVEGTLLFSPAGFRPATQANVISTTKQRN